MDGKLHLTGNNRLIHRKWSLCLMFEVWNHVPWIIWFSNLDSWPVFTPFLISWLINSWMQLGDGSIQYMAIQSESPMPIPFLKGLVGGLMMISSLGFGKYLSRFDLQGKTCVRIFTCFPTISLLLDGHYERCSGHWVAEGCNIYIVSEVVMFNPPSKLPSIQPYSTPSVIVLVDFSPRNIRQVQFQWRYMYSPKKKQQYHPKVMVNLWYAPLFFKLEFGPCTAHFQMLLRLRSWDPDKIPYNRWSQWFDLQFQKEVGKTTEHFPGKTVLVTCKISDHSKQLLFI